MNNARFYKKRRFVVVTVSCDNCVLNSVFFDHCVTPIGRMAKYEYAKIAKLWQQAVRAFNEKETVFYGCFTRPPAAIG
jgi:hypothetical protein